MSTYYRPVRRGPRALTVVVLAGVLLVLSALAFTGWRAYVRTYEMPTAAHPLACQNLDTDWTLEWSFWHGWYCKPDFGTKLIPMSAPLPIKVTGGWPAGAPEKVPGWIVFLDPGHQPAFIHVRGAAWVPHHPLNLRVWPWTGSPYTMYGPLDIVFTTTQPLDLRA